MIGHISGMGSLLPTTVSANLIAAPGWRAILLGAAPLRTLTHAVFYALGISTLMARCQSCMRILMFHGIGQQDTAQFTRQLEYLAKRYSIVPLETIVQKAADPSAKPAREIALTFDDGLRSHCAVVYPILRRMNLPATFFICPGLVDSGRWIWTQEARARLRRLSSVQRVGLARELGAPADQTGEIIDWMKMVPLSRRIVAESAIRELTLDYQPAAEESENLEIMTWQEIMALDPSLITIGAHSVHHHILTSLSDADLESELRDGRARLESMLRRPVDLFCYPNGTFDARVLQFVRKYYRAAVTTTPGRLVGGHNLYTLPRSPSADNLPLLAWRMHRPAA